MNVKFWLLLSLSLVLCGCSSQKNAHEVSNGTEITETGENSVSEVRAPTVGASENEVFPLKIHVEPAGQNDDGDAVVVVNVEREGAAGGKYVMRILPKEGTVTNFGNDEIDLSELETATKTSRNIVLHGDNPGFEVQVRVAGQGFAMMVRETWPPEKVPQNVGADIRTDLPAPIVVEGVVLDRGVNVRP